MPIAWARWSFCLLGLLWPGAVSRVAAQSPARTSGFVEAGGGYAALTGGYGDWYGGYLRGVATLGRHTLNAELSEQHEFGDAGVYVTAGDTYVLSSNWYGALAVGGGPAGFFYPKLRIDATLSRKWLRLSQLVTTLGFGYAMAKDAHRDYSAFAGAAYYLPAPWIVEGGFRLNVSNPGSVPAASGFIAITQGRLKEHYLVLRLGIGREAYQLIGPTTTLSDFGSQTVTLTWRQWVNSSWGLSVVGDYYHNPFYWRGGTSVGVFHDF